MGALVQLSNGYNDRQLALIRKTVCRDCDRDSKGIDLKLGEFDWAMSICKHLNLNPLLKQIYFFVFNKDDADRRQMVPVVSINGYRTIADRTGNYRPGPSVLKTDDTKVNADTNPVGLVYAEATVFKYAHGEWHPITERAYWDEYAPIVVAADQFDWVDTGETWPDTGKPKKKKVAKPGAKSQLDPKKDGWRKMPRVLLEKCAEARAIRRGWPDETAGTYGEGELDRKEVLELTATEMADNADATAKLALIGGPNALTVDWCNGSPLERVPEGAFCDRVLAWMRAKDRCETEVKAFWQRNLAARGEFKARHGADYLALQKAYDAQCAKLAAAEGEVVQ